MGMLHCFPTCSSESSRDIHTGNVVFLGKCFKIMNICRATIQRVGTAAFRTVRLISDQWLCPVVMDVATWLSHVASPMSEAVSFCRGSRDSSDPPTRLQTPPHAGQDPVSRSCPTASLRQEEAACVSCPLFLDRLLVFAHCFFNQSISQPTVCPGGGGFFSMHSSVNAFVSTGTASCER
jgi:hypothetical protein